jgi:hypothetical protein
MASTSYTHGIDIAVNHCDQTKEDEAVAVDPVVKNSEVLQSVAWCQSRAEPVQIDYKRMR